MNSVTLTLQSIELPGLNVWQRWHTMKRHRYKATVATSLLVAWCQAGRPLAKGRRAKLRVTHVRTKRIKDADNLAVTMKALGDALKKRGVIVDDSMDWIDVEIRQETRQGRPPHVVVEVTYQ